MKRASLIALSLLVSVIGITSLFFLKPEVSPQHFQLTGEVTNVYKKGSTSFIKFVPDDFLVVSFNEVNLSGNHTLTGRLHHYKGRVEFIVESYD